MCKLSSLASAPIVSTIMPARVSCKRQYWNASFALSVEPQWTTLNGLGECALSASNSSKVMRTDLLQDGLLATLLLCWRRRRAARHGLLSRHGCHSECAPAGLGEPAFPHRSESSQARR